MICSGTEWGPVWLGHRKLGDVVEVYWRVKCGGDMEGCHGHLHTRVWVFMPNVTGNLGGIGFPA